MKIYTRKGDLGQTSLWRGGKVAKSDPRIEAIGCVDEVNAYLGVCIAALPGALQGGLGASLVRCQRDLFDIGAELADAKGGRRITAAHVARLEGEIDSMCENVPPLANFILPGGSLPAAHLHAARTIARRAERSLAALLPQSGVSELALSYLNRLSDYLFVAARFVNASLGAAEAAWKGDEG